jgi:hypothetical protein
MLGPCQPAQRVIPNILRRRKGNNSQGTFVLLGEGNDSSEERLEQGDKIERTKWGKRIWESGEWRS